MFKLDSEKDYKNYLLLKCNVAHMEMKRLTLKPTQILLNLTNSFGTRAPIR